MAAKYVSKEAFRFSVSVWGREWREGYCTMVHVWFLSEWVVKYPPVLRRIFIFLL